MADWGAIIGAAAAIAQGYAAKKAADAQKADYNNQQKNYQDAMAMEQERVNRARNSPFSPISFALLDQALHIYGDQSKGRGGFKLPVDSLSAMLGGYYPQDGAPNSGGGGGFGGGGSNGPIPAQGWGGPNGDSVSPQERQRINEIKAQFAARQASGEPMPYDARGGGRGGGPKIQRREGSILGGDAPSMGFGGAGGGFGSESDQIFNMMFEQNYKDRLAAKGLTRGVSIDSMMGGNAGDNLRNAAWWYAGRDGDLTGQGNTWGEVKQGAYRLPLQLLPSGVSQAASLGLREIDKTMPWMYDYNNWGSAPQGVWNISPQMFNYLQNGGTGYGSSQQGPPLTDLFQ